VADRLNALTPGQFANRTVLFSTGAEAVENAVQIARAATGRPGVVVFDHAYHGRTLLTLAMTAKDVPYKQGFGPFSGDVHRAPFAYPLRWPTGPERAATEALAALDGLLARVGADTVAAIVVEPLVIPQDLLEDGLGVLEQAIRSAGHDRRAGTVQGLPPVASAVGP